MAAQRVLPPAGRIGIVVSRFNETVTTRLLEGARRCLSERGIDERQVDVAWVAGAWELPVVARALLAGGGYQALCALGAVVRGETPHFDFIANACAQGLMALQVEFGVPVGFGVLTTDTLGQALARAGGDAGNKGHDAMAASLDAAALLGTRDERPH
jgi:6,7-dimethyl-8-ribityllumazine synthase